MPKPKHAGMKPRWDVGTVETPIETLLEARTAGYHCLHIEAALEAKAGAAPLIKEPSHAAVMGKDPKLKPGSSGF